MAGCTYEDTKFTYFLDENNLFEQVHNGSVFRQIMNTVNIRNSGGV